MWLWTWTSLSRGHGQYMFLFTSDSIGLSKLCELWDYWTDTEFCGLGTSCSGGELHLELRMKVSKTLDIVVIEHRQIYVGLFTLLTIPSWCLGFSPCFLLLFWQAVCSLLQRCHRELKPSCLRDKKQHRFYTVLLHWHPSVHSSAACAAQFHSYIPSSATVPSAMLWE